MSLAPAKTRFTPQDVDRLPDAVNYELVDGNLVERHMGSESSAIASKIIYRLLMFIEQAKSGHIFTADCGYVCFPDDPDKLRKPDVSFVANGRLPGNRPPTGYIRIAPDLAVEVISPGDFASEIEDKVQDYLSAGVKLIWIVNPKTKSVRIRRPGSSKFGPSGELTEADTISGEDVLPGFECSVSEFFQI